MKNNDAISAFLALGQETRLNIFRLVVQKGDIGLTPGEIVEKLGIPNATLSFHLKELVNANRHMDIDRDNRFMTLALNLLERVREEHYQLECMDYWDTDLSFNDIPDKPDLKSIEIETKNERFDEYLSKYPSSVRAITKKHGVIEDKKTLCLRVSYYNHSKANKLLFRVLEERLAQWWD